MSSTAHSSFVIWSFVTCSLLTDSRMGRYHVGKNSRRLADSRAAHQDRSDAADAGHLSRRLPDSSCRSSIRPQVERVQRARAAASATCCKQVAVFSASQLKRGHDLRPGHHAVHLGVDHLPAAGAASIRRSSSCRRKARAAARKSTNTRATRRVFLCLVPKLVLRRVVRRAAGTGGRRRLPTIRRRSSSGIGRSPPC